MGTSGLLQATHTCRFPPNTSAWAPPGPRAGSWPQTGRRRLFKCKEEHNILKRSSTSLSTQVRVQATKNEHWKPLTS